MRPIIAATFFLLLLGCDSAPPPAPIVVYAIGDDESTLAARLAEFTKDTDIGVTLMFSKSSRNADLVIDNSGSPPADVLITNNIADIWRAGEEGGLRKIQTTSIENVAEGLRDPDGLWVAFDVRYAVIRGSSVVASSTPAGFLDLAGPEFADQLCMSSSRLPVNRSLIAMLIDELGVRPAERSVRGWLRNLARPTFDTEADLREAIEAGACPYAIVSVASGSKSNYADIDGIGIARHARFPDSANALVDWLLQKKSLQEFDAPNGRNVGIAGWRNEEALLLVERVGYH